MDAANGFRTLTRSQFARHRGVSAPAVTQWAQAGRIVLAPNGDVIVDESDALLAATQTAHVGKRGAPAVSKRTRGRPAAAYAAADGDPETLTEARIAQARARARLDELEYRERAGELVERRRYDQALADAVAPILSRLDSLANRAAPKLVGIADMSHVIGVIDDEVIALRQDIADTLEAMSHAGGATKQ